MREIVAALAVGLIVFSASFVVGQTGSPQEVGSRNPFGTNLKVPVQIGNGKSLVDLSSWLSASNVRMNKVNANIQGNVFVQDVQLNITGPSIGGVNSESAAILSRCKTANQSGANTYDCVGIDARGIITPGNMTGRTWGGYFEGNASAGADGATAAIEAASANFATADDSTPGSITSKTGIGIVAGGTQHSTAAINIIGVGGTSWHKGIFANVNFAILGGATDAFIEAYDTTIASDVWKVDRWGVQSSGRLVSLAAPFTPTASGTGGGSGATYVVGAGSSDMAGVFVMTAGTSAGSAGSAIITFSTAAGDYGASVETSASLKNGTGSWNPRATAIISTENATSTTIFWDNNSVALTNGLVYRINYHIFGR